MASEEGAENHKDGVRTASIHHAGLATIPSSLLRVGSVPELYLLTLLSIQFLWRPAEARQLRWCDVKIVDGSLSTHYEEN